MRISYRLLPKFAPKITITPRGVRVRLFLKPYARLRARR